MAFFVAAVIGYGCDGDGESAGASEEQIASACDEYCTPMIQCDDEATRDSCTTFCESKMTECGGSEQMRAVSDLETCAERYEPDNGAQRCDAFLSCSVGEPSACRLTDL